MPVAQDFRNFSFHLPRIERCGKYIGRRSYWRLYAFENLLRVVIHSVLAAQLGKNWWALAVDPDIRKTANRFRSRYAKKPWHTLPGRHDIYYVFLSDLNNIVRANSNVFLPVIPDVDQWIVRIEGVITPRNLVGHMNFPDKGDRQRIDDLHRDFSNLVSSLQQSGLVIDIP